MSPPAGFIGGDPIVRTRPSDIDNTITAVASSSMMDSATGLRGEYDHFSPVITTSSIYIESAVSSGRGYEKRKLNATLLGQSVNSIGRPPFPSANVIDVNLTGSFESPSWTHTSIGTNHGFVMHDLSSSIHEVTSLNCFFSGTEGLELSAVPASSSLYYSKRSRLSTVTVKHTASILDTTRVPNEFTPVVFAELTGTDISFVTGSVDDAYGIAGFNTLLGTSILVPASIKIDVPVSGKIVDIKVWIEMMTVSGSGFGVGYPGGVYPLGSFFAALRSPNVTWGHAHPIRNDAALKRVFTSNLGDFSLANKFGAIGSLFFGPKITISYRDSFILWEGPSIFGPSSVAGPWDRDEVTGSLFVTSRYPSFQRDRGMRTVFCDGAKVSNPRHLIGPTSQSFSGAPNSAFGANSAWGMDVPWTSEHELSGANTYQANGSPPPGWLTGPGGTNAVNEWPTTGVNYGATQIRPLYPLLDPIYQRKVYTNDAPLVTVTGSEAVLDSNSWQGFRPGLRGTEVSGTWTLLLAGGGGISVGGFPRQSMFFKQVRLEFVLENASYSEPRRIRNERIHTPRRSKELGPIHSISGSDLFQMETLTTVVGTFTGSWDCFVSQNFEFPDQRTEIGCSFGLSLNSGTFSSDSALVYRLSGSLADIVGQTPSWLLSGHGNMPIIPQSSASLVPVRRTAIETLPFLDFMSPRRDFDLPQRLIDVASDANPQLRLRDLADAFVSSSAS